MSSFTLSDEARSRLEKIVDYTQQRWGDAQAVRYFDGFLAQFDAIAARQLHGRAIPDTFGVDGRFCRYERHFIYWTTLSDGTVRIVTILHERMQQMEALRTAFDR